MRQAVTPVTCLGDGGGAALGRDGVFTVFFCGLLRDDHSRAIRRLVLDGFEGAVGVIE
jgi:hypothetical protein